MKSDLHAANFNSNELNQFSLLVGIPKGALEAVMTGHVANLSAKPARELLSLLYLRLNLSVQ